MYNQINFRQKANLEMSGPSAPAAPASSTAAPAAPLCSYGYPELDPSAATNYDLQEIKDLLARYGVAQDESYLKIIQTVRSVDPSLLGNSVTVLKEAKETIAAAQYGFGDLSKLGLQWVTIVTDMLNKVHNAVGADGTLIQGSVEESLHVLFGALQTGFSNRKVLDLSYEASIVSGSRVSIAPAMNALKAAVGRKITGADLQALQAVMAAMRKSQGEFP